MIANLLDLGRALELADNALRDAEEAFPRFRDDHDIVLLASLHKIAGETEVRACRLRQGLHAALITQGGEF